MTIKVFRWKAIGPLLLALAAIGVLVLVFAEPVAPGHDRGREHRPPRYPGGRGASSTSGRARSVRDLWQIEVADPFDVSRNLVEAGSVHLTVDPEALAEKKLVVRNLTLRGMQFGTGARPPRVPPTATASRRRWCAPCGSGPSSSTCRCSSSRR